MNLITRSRRTLITGAVAVAALGLTESASAATGTIKATGGSGKVIVQSTPSVSGKNLRYLRNGAKVRIVCQTYGQTMSGPFGSSNVWNKLARGGYVTDTKTYTGSDGLVAPLCPGTNPGGGGGAGTDAAVTSMTDDYKETGNVDPWNFYVGQCTSFVAFRLNKGGVPFTNQFKGRHFSNANTWDEAARAVGIPVDGTPRVGAVMQSNAGTYGHVAVVSKVLSGNRITIEEYNKGGTEQYSQRTISAAGLNFIHIKK